MSCFFRHTWSKWSEPYMVNVGAAHWYTGQITEYKAHKQRRTCEVCGKAKFRWVK